MRPGLTAKLFVAMLAVALFAVLAMGIAARISFDRGFLGYLAEQEVQHMRSMGTWLGTSYRENGSWDFLRRDPRAWGELMHARNAGFANEPWHDHDHYNPSSYRNNSAQPPAFGQPPGLVPDKSGGNPPGNPPSLPQGMPPPGMVPGMGPQMLPADMGPPDPNNPGNPDHPGEPPHDHGNEPPMAPFTLLDADGHYVFGNPSPIVGHAAKLPIEANGKTVGYLVAVPFREVTEQGDLRFQQGQYRASWIIGLAALLLAALIAIWLARTLLVPVHRIAGATHQLAKGDFSSRVETSSHDELGQLARDFNRLAVVLEQNERSRREFVADVSHELRTPLSIIRGELEALEDGVRRFDNDALKSLQLEVGTLSKLIDDLYQLSLADLGSMAYRKIDVDIGKLLTQTVDASQERLRKAQLQMDLRLPSRPLMVSADESRLHQLFSNLLENSLRYTDAGGSLRVECVAAHDSVVVHWMDSSPGVSEGNLPRLFERFYRVEGSRNRASGGAGLGLSICRSIVEAHDGTIQAAASPLGGLWLTIRLPLELA